MAVVATAHRAHLNTSVDWVHVLPGGLLQSSGRDCIVRTYELPQSKHCRDSTPQVTCPQGACSARSAPQNRACLSSPGWQTCRPLHTAHICEDALATFSVHVVCRNSLALDSKAKQASLPSSTLATRTQSSGFLDSRCCACPDSAQHQHIAVPINLAAICTSPLVDRAVQHQLARCKEAQHHAHPEPVPQLHFCNEGVMRTRPQLNKPACIDTGTCGVRHQSGWSTVRPAPWRCRA